MSGTISTGVPRNEIIDVLLNGKFQNIVTVAKTGRANFVCSDYPSDSACIQAALDYLAARGGGEVFIMDGYYTMSTQLKYLSDDIIFRGHGNNTILDFTNVPERPLAHIDVNGSISTTNSVLTADANATDLTITVANGSLFSAGNWIRIRSEAIFQPKTIIVTDDSWTEKVAEYQQIESVSGNVLTLKEKLFGSYKVSDSATVDLSTMRKNIAFRDFRMIGPVGVDHNGIMVKYGCHVRFDNVTFDDTWMSAIYLYDVVDASVTNTTVHRAYKDLRGYGLSVSNASRDISASNNHYFNCRHAITCCGDSVTSDPKTGYGIQYNQTYIGNTFSYDSKDQAMFGMHPSYDGLTVNGNTVTNGGLGFFNGRNSTVVGNTAKNSEVWAISLPSCAENVLIANNTIESKAGHSIAVRTQYKNIKISNNIIINSDPNSDGISVANQIEGLEIENNHIESASDGVTVATYLGIDNSSEIKIFGNEIISTGTSGITLNLYDGTLTMSNVTIENNTIIAPSSGASVLLSRTNGTALFSKIDIKNNICRGGNDTLDISYADKITIKDNHVYDATRGLVFHNNNGSYNIDRNEFTNCGTSLVNNMAESGNRVTDNLGYNPVGLVTAPGIPASGTARSNTHAYPCRIAVSGGTVTTIAIDGTATGLTSGSFILQPAETITLTYSVAPTWVWWGL